jgi:signal transduction histidine kinase
MRVVAPATRVLAEIDPTKVALALSNLVSNALRFARHEVTISVVASGSNASIDVVDDGAGVPESGLATIFNRVEAAVAATGGRSGSGLGLAIVRGIARAHGGDVRAENVTVDGKTRGARFSVILPLTSNP